MAGKEIFQREGGKALADKGALVILLVLSGRRWID